LALEAQLRWQQYVQSLTPEELATLTERRSGTDVAPIDEVNGNNSPNS
jgi:hypothetical protein